MKLKVVASYIKKKAREQGLDKKTSRTHPKEEYDVEKEERSLGELFGRGANLVIKDKFEISKLERGFGSVEDGKLKDLSLDKCRLKSDNYEDRLRYENEKREKEALQKKEDREKKKMELMKVRMEIEQDKLARMDKVWIKKSDLKKKSEKDIPVVPGNTEYDDKEF